MTCLEGVERRPNRAKPKAQASSAAPARRRESSARRSSSCGENGPCPALRWSDKPQISKALANLHGGEPLKPLWAKKLLVEGAVRHRIRRRKIEFAGDAPPHENQKGPIALVSVRPTESDISVDRRLHRLAGRHRWRPTSNGEKDRAETVRRVAAGVQRGAPASRVHRRRHKGFGQAAEIPERPRHRRRSLCY